MAIAQITQEQVAVEIASDKLAACVQVPSPGKPCEVTEQDVLSAIEGANVTIDDAVKSRVSEFVALAADGKLDTKPFCVATGTPAQDAEDERFKWNADYHDVLSEWKDGVDVDYFTIDAITVVEADAAIGTIVPPVSAKDGQDVLGVAIPASGAPAPLRLDKSVRVSSDDQSIVVSNVRGKVTIADHTLSVVDLRVVDGDLQPGAPEEDPQLDARVEGRILDGARLDVMGTITVCGAIEAANVSAGGDVVVARGIIGRSSGSVAAAGNIVAKFASDVNLTATKNVKIVNQLMNCHTYAGERVCAERASVIGGHLLAGEGIEASELGSSANVATRVVVGVRAAELGEALALQSRLARVGELIEEIRSTVEPVVAQADGVSEQQAGYASDLIAFTKEAAASAEAESVRRNDLLANPYLDNESSVLVTGMIHAGTTVRIGDRETVFRSDTKGPTSLERHKIKNVTEVVAVNPETGSKKILKSERRTIEELLETLAAEM